MEQFSLERVSHEASPQTDEMYSVAVQDGELAVIRPGRRDSGRANHPDAVLVTGLCHPPSEAIIASASFGPQLPRL